MVESRSAGGVGHPGRRDPRAPGDAEPRADAAPPRHPGVRAGADRGQGDPAASAGLRGVQRRLRRRPDGGARAAVARSADGSAHADAGVEQRAARRRTASRSSCRRRTSCSACTTPRASASTRRARRMVFADVAEVGARLRVAARSSCTRAITVRITGSRIRRRTARRSRRSCATRPRSAARCCRRSCRSGLPFELHQQGAQEEGDLAAHQRGFPPLRAARDGDLRRQADAGRLHLRHARAASRSASTTCSIPAQKQRASSARPRTK